MITKKHFSLIVSIFLILLPTLSFAQQKDNPKYLANAVPLIDGKVEFTRTININQSVSQKQLYELVKAWVDTAYVTKDKASKKGILYENADENIILVRGDDKLVFKAQILSIDQAFMEYRLTIKAEKGKCILNFSHIRYRYQDFKTFEKAEDLIADKIAYNQAKNKLNRYYDKFRMFTIDRIDNITNNLKEYLSSISTSQVSSEQAKILADKNKIVPNDENTVSIVGVTPDAKLMSSEYDGFKSLNSNDVPSSFDAIISQSRIIVANKASNKILEYRADWNGMTEIRKSPVSIITIYDDGNNAESYGDKYTIYFINEAANKDFLNSFKNTADSSKNKLSEKAWMILECETAIMQNQVDSSLKIISSPWPSESKDDKKTVMGDILNIWVK